MCLDYEYFIYLTKKCKNENGMKNLSENELWIFSHLKEQVRLLKAMSIYSVLWHSSFNFDIFSSLSKNKLTNRQNKCNFVISESILIELDTLLACRCG